MNSQTTITKLQSADLTEPITVNLSDRLAVKLYKDCRPNCLETAALQKGLVLLFEGHELIEEGMGFGVPIVKYEDKTFFSSTADVSIRKVGSDSILIKVYSLDTVSLKKFGQTSYIDDGLYSSLSKTFQMLYLKHKKLTPIFNKAMELRNVANIKTEFVAVKPRGTITVTYTCQPTAINVQVDFSHIILDKCLELIVLNEQGSSVFKRYVDSNGLTLLGNKIGAWDEVTATQASLQSDKHEISFILQKEDGIQLFRGWEQTRKRFSWAGLSYSLVPNRGIFTYTIGFKLQK